MSTKSSTVTFPKPKKLQIVSAKIRAHCDIAYSNSQYAGLNIGEPMQYYPGRMVMLFSAKCLEPGHPMENKMISFSTEYIKKRQSKVVSTLVF